MASTIQLRIPRGNTTTRTFTASSGNAPLDLTGYSIRVIIKTSEDTSDGDSLTVTESGAVVNATAGSFTVPIPGADLPNAETLWWRADAVSEADDTNWFTIVKGPLVVEPV